MQTDSPLGVTALLHRWSCGDAESLEELMPLVFEDLRQIARRMFQQESNPHTLQPTALISEVYLRLTSQRQTRWESRKQFFSFAGALMRRILVDHAKAKGAAKRGGGVARLPLDESIPAPAAGVDIIALDQALSRLAEHDPRMSRLVELRFFAGLELEEIGEVLSISLTTVKRDWITARVWLLRELTCAQGNG